MIVIISLLLDSIFSDFTTIFYPLFTLTSLIIIYNKNILKYSIILGFIYGLVFTNLFFVEILSYFICSLFITYFFKKNHYNLINTLILTILNIIIYRVINFLILSILKIIDFKLNILFESIYTSLIINILFILICYLFKTKCNKKTYKIYN